MADVAVETPVAIHKPPAAADSVPIIDSLEGTGNDSGDEYATLKRLQRHLEYVLKDADKQRSLTVWFLGTFTCKKSTSKTSKGIESTLIRDLWLWFFFSLTLTDDIFFYLGV